MVDMDNSPPQWGRQVHTPAVNHTMRIGRQQGKLALYLLATHNCRGALLSIRLYKAIFILPCRVVVLDGSGKKKGM
jgi:hypothetical protein